MTTMNLVRIAKVIALLAFVLPWVAVSCQGVDAATASGLDLMQGRMTPNPQFEQQMKSQLSGVFGQNANLPSPGDPDVSFENGDTSNLGLNFFAIGAGIAVIAGLALSFLGKGKTALRNVLVTSLVGMALVFGSVWWFRESVKRDMAEEETGSAAPFAAADNPFASAGGLGANMMDNLVQERWGYWIVLVALGVAAGASAIGMSAAGAKPEGSA